MESDSRHELTKLLKLLQIDIAVGHSRIVNILSNEQGGSREYGEGIQLVNVLRNQEYDEEIRMKPRQ